MKRHKRHRSPTPVLELESCQQSKSGFIFSSVDGFKVALRRREGRSPTPVLEARIPAPLEARILAPLETETESPVDNAAHDDDEDAVPFNDEEDDDPFDDDPFDEDDNPFDDNPFDEDDNPFDDNPFDDNPFDEDENPFYDDDDAEQRRLNDLFLDEEQRAAWFDDRLHGRLHPPVSSDSDDGVQIRDDSPSAGLEECESLSFSSALYRIS
ncbi:hypothetical protein HKX48_005130 [Thoreauomyces humboldtii]|nr:hypothetical protein HKX48_005130 [Thoreauomyces humboldtii]